MTIYQFLSIMRARWLIVLSILLVTVTLTAVLSFFVLDPTYTGSVDLVVDAKGQDPITGTITQVQIPTGYADTQADIINSQAVSMMVIKRLGLDRLPGINNKYLLNTTPEERLHGTLTQWLANYMIKKLDVKPSRDSNVITLNFDWGTSEGAAEIANAYAEAYLQTCVDLRAQPAKQLGSWYDEQLKALRTNVDVAQRKLSDYQRTNGIVAGDERIDVETSKLQQLSEALVNAQNQRYNNETRENQLSGSNVSDTTLSEVLGSSTVEGLKAQLSTEEAKLAQISISVGKNHPQYVEEKAVVDGLHERLDHEINAARSSVKDNAQISQHMETDLRAAVAAQKQKVLDLKRQRDVLNVLSQDADNAQHTYENALQRASQSKLEGQLAQTDVAILSPALPPIDPSKPKKALNCILAFFLGGLMGIAVAVLVETRHRRIRSAEDLSEILGLPILSVLERTSVPKRRRNANVVVNLQETQA